MTLLVGFGEEQRFVDRLATRFDARVDNLLEFARRTRVALLRTADGVPIWPASLHATDRGSTVG